MKRFVKNITVFIMLCLLAAPASMCLFTSKQIYALNENRALKEFPTEWKDLFEDNNMFANQLSEFFNDRFQFRDLLIRTKGELEYRVFGVTGDNGVYVGSNGYMYYKSVVEREQIANERLTEKDIYEIVSAYERLKNYINSNHAECLFLIPPQKNTAFPERTPVFNVERKQPNKYEILIDMLSVSNIKNDFIDVLPLLRDAETKYPVYYKTDFHWNGYGAAAAYTEVVNRLFQRMNIEYEFNDSMYEIYFQPDFTGGQLNNMPLLEKWKENAVFVRKKTDITTYADPNYTSENKSRHYFNTNKNAPLGSVLFIGDSYTEYMLDSQCGILDLFKEAWFVHADFSEDSVSSYIEDIDYVVVEKIESGMVKLADMINHLYAVYD